MKRIHKIKSEYRLNTLPNDEIIKNYFVEIFSWSVFTPRVVEIIGNTLKQNNINQVIDPCAGNAFHTFILNSKLGIDVHTVDIQNEPNSWLPITELDGRSLLKNLSSQEHNKSALLLSWIDYESLTIELLEAYHGNLIISVGNYEGKSPIYLQKLHDRYNLKTRVILQMPWELEEKIEIYVRK